MPLTTREADQAAGFIRRIRALLPKAMLRDRAAAVRRLGELRSRYGLGAGPEGHKKEIWKPKRSAAPASPEALLGDLAYIEESLARSAAEREARRRRLPALHIPPALPIAEKRREIVAALKRHPVIIISGETGCGKSTQLPKMCLEAGRGVAGKIACTQPRRIAAITIAHRIAEELGEPLGCSVGYKIRFQDRTQPEAYIKIMTDGMLLAETQTDRRLYEYDTLIIDETHERSLNIDFLLGISRILLDVRPELKIIITSATLDTEKFSRTFSNAPVIHVGGRMYPVEVEYMPPESFGRGAEESDYVDLAVRAVEKLRLRKLAGDILVFMPTEQDILETCEKLEGKLSPATTVLPLYARLPAAQQGRVYSVKGAKIVVATNVAETSLTIPGIRSVVDTGLARIAQYQPGTRINSLPISMISRASADQRKGRCGRVREGLCIRLYSEEDYKERPAFTPPEILRSNLAEVILRMIDLRLGLPSEFPFVDAPHPKNIKDGYEILLELGAATGSGREYELTAAGKRMARMPLDPRLSRMLLEAAEEDCLREVAIIASALSIRDPRERPPDQAGLADQAQLAFAHPDSDFLTLLNIWDRFYESEGAATKSRLRKFCHENYLSYTRMREWKFVHDQIVSILEEQRIPLGRRERVEIMPVLYAGIHRSVLSGFLSNIAVHKEKNVYSAAKSREVMVFPGSVLFNKSRPWVVAAEIVRTSRLYARTAAKIDPAWLESLGGALCRYSYSDPRWDVDRGEVRAKERVTLFGLEIVRDRDVSYGPKAPEEAQAIFIREALVEGCVKAPPDFLKQNLALQKEVLDMEEKLRRRDIMVGEDAIAGFYSRRLGGVYDLRGLEKRIRQAGSDDFLRMNRNDLLLAAPDDQKLALFPDQITLGGKSFASFYRFAPGGEEDGVTLRVPAPQVAWIPGQALDWGIPGYFPEKIAALIKGLPKACRKQLMPFAEKAATIAKEMKRTDVPLFEALSRFVRDRFGADIPAEEWAKAEIPAYLRTRIAVTDHRGEEIAAGRNLDELRRAAAPTAMPEDSPEWRAAREKWEKEGLVAWDFGDLPESVKVGAFLVGYLGLEPAQKGVRIKLFKTRAEALASHQRGVEALLALRFAKDTDFLRRYLVLPEEMEKAALYFGGKAGLEKAMQEHVRREIFRRNIRAKEEFEAYASSVMQALYEKSHLLREAVERILDLNLKLRGQIQEMERAARSSKGILSFFRGLREEVEALLPPNFLKRYSLERLRHLPRYLQALQVRAERARNGPEKDAKKAAEVKPFAEALAGMEKGLGGESSEEKREAVAELRWMVEEFKVSLFAPELRTAFPISAKRLALKIKEIGALNG